MTKKIDETGSRYGRLVVIKQGPHIGEHVAWICKCDCGNTTNIRGWSLRTKDGAKSCGCLNEEYKKKQEKNLLGRRFGKLVVLEYSHTKNAGTKKAKRYWKCQCDCGNITYVATGNFSRRKSCGCLHKGSYPEGKSAQNRVYKKYEGGARNRNLEWDLDKEEFKKLTQ